MKYISTKIICPTCNGSGFFNVTIDFPQEPQEELIKKIRLLNKKGLSLRQIAVKVGIKNAGTVKYYLDK